MLARATPAELARIPRIRAEFRPWRPLAFELQRRGYAVRDWVLPGSSASVLHGRWPSCGVAEKARIGRDLFRSEDDRPAAKPATPLLSLRWTFRAKRACVALAAAVLLALSVVGHAAQPWSACFPRRATMARVTSSSSQGRKRLRST